MNRNFRYFKNRNEFITFISNSNGLIPKEKLICELCKDKDVLDIGCIDHSYKTALALGDDWLHKRLKDVSKSIVGLDILGEDIRKLNKRGFNIIEANAESFNLNRTFDVIVAHACSVKGICMSILFKHTKITVYLQKQMLFL